MSLDYAAMQAAIKSAVVAGSGLPARSVLWAYQAYQGQERPQNERFITMMIGPSISHGIDSFDVTTDLNRPLGQEVILTTSTVQEFGIMLQCFGGTPAGNGTALQALERFRNRLALPTVRGYFTDAGMSPFNSGTVQYVPAIEGTKFESRAVLDMRCYVEASETDYVGFIARVSGNYEFTDAGTFVVLDGTFDVSTGE